MAQPRWDEQEVALLLDAYLRIEAGSSQKTVAEELSDTLRLRAVNHGFDIDDQFRNVNGMVMQLSNMQFVMTDGKRGLYGASSLIREVIQKRKTDPQWFDQLLREAKASVSSSEMQQKTTSTSQSENHSAKASALQKEELCVSEVQSHEDRFYEWLASRVSPAQLSVMYQAFRGLDQALIQSGRIGSPVLNNTDISRVRMISNQLKTDWGLRKVLKRENTSLLEKALDFFIQYLEENSSTKPSIDVPPSPNPTAPSDKLAEITKEYNLRYKDERSNGGSFWIVMPFRNDKYLNACREHGVVFHMKATGSPFHGQLSWYTNDTWQEVFAVKPLVNPPPTPNPPAFDGGNSPDAATQDGLVEIVKRYGFRYEDNRSKGGVFWIAMPRYNNRFKQECKSHNVTFQSVSIGRGPFPNQTSWYTKDTWRNNEATPPTPNPSPLVPKLPTPEETERISIVKNAFIDWLKRKPRYSDSWATWYVNLRPIMKLIDEDRRFPFFYLIPEIEPLRRIRKQLTLSSNSVALKRKGIDQAALNALEVYTNFVQESYPKFDKIPVPPVPPPPAPPAPPQRKNDPRIESILLRAFPNGIRKSSSIELHKFRREWKNTEQAECSYTDEQLREQFEACCIDTGDRWYMPQSLLNDDDRKLVDDELLRFFDGNHHVLYYEAFYAQIQHLLSNSKVTPELFASALKALYRDKFHFFANFLSDQRQPAQDIAYEIRQAMISAGMPMTVAQLCERLGHLPPEKIEQTLKENSSFIKNTRNKDTGGEFFYEGMVSLTAEDVQAIGDIISGCILREGYALRADVLRRVDSQIPDVAEQLQRYSLPAKWEIISRRMCNRFGFTETVACEKGRKLAATEVLSMFCQNHTPFSLQEFKDFAEEAGTQPFTYIPRDSAFRVSENQYIAKNEIAFPISQVDAAIELYCTGDYLPVTAICHLDPNFHAFPFVGHAWNAYMLEQYVYDHSRTFRLCFGGNTCASGIIVRKKLQLEDNDLLSLILADSDVELKQEPAVNWLYDNGYIPSHTKSWASESILRRAKLIREEREK